MLVNPRPAALVAVTALFAGMATPAPADACSAVPEGWYLQAVLPAEGQAMPANGAIVLAARTEVAFDVESLVDALSVELTGPDGERVAGQLALAPAGVDLVWWPDAALTPGVTYRLHAAPIEGAGPFIRVFPIEDRAIRVGPAVPDPTPGHLISRAAHVFTETVRGGCTSVEHLDSCGECGQFDALGERAAWRASVTVDLPEGAYSDARLARIALGTSPVEAQAILARTPLHDAPGSGPLVLEASAGAVADWPHETACAAVEVIDPVAGPLIDAVTCFDAPIKAIDGVRPAPAGPRADRASTGCDAGAGGGTSAAWALALLFGFAGRRRRMAAVLATAAFGLFGCDDGPDDCFECDFAEFERPPIELPPMQTEGPTPPPLIGGALAIEGDIAVVGDTDRDRVLVVDLATRTVLAEHAGGQPGRVIIGDGRAYVTLRTEGAVLVLETEGGAEIGRHPVCAAPRGVARAWGALHVACAGGALVTLDRNGHITRRLPLVPDLRDVVVAGGLLHISRFRTPELLSVDRDGTVVARRAPETFDILRGGLPSAPTVAWRTIALPSGLVLMLHQRARLDAIPTSEPGGYGGESGGFSCGGGIVTTELTGFHPSGDNPMGPQAVAQLPQAVVALDMTLIGDRLAITAPGNSDVAAWRTGVIPDLDLRDSGTWGDCRFPRGELIHTGEVKRHVAIAEHRDRLVGLLRDTPALADIDGNVLVELGGEAVRHTGRDLFHADAGRGIACASCHPEGSQDGHTWLFQGHGLRRTQELRGGLAGTAPFHWTGDMTDMQHLMDEVMTRRMGGPDIPPAYTDAMMTWLDAQAVDPVDPIVGGDPVAGAVLFEDAYVGCAGCHSGPRYSDDVHYDVGTGGRFVTPTLLGVGRRGALMHDGCTETLAGRFDSSCGGGEQHGRTRHLDTDDIRDLIAYLATL